DDFGWATEMLERRPEKRSVKTLFTVGDIGDPPTVLDRMPPGAWAVFERDYRHYALCVLDATITDVDGEVTFCTTDSEKLAEILANQPFDSFNLRRLDGGGAGMRDVLVETI